MLDSASGGGRVGGVCSRGVGVSALGGSAPGGGLLLEGGVSALGGIPACTETDPPCEQNDRQTGVKILPWPQLRCGR